MFKAKIIITIRESILDPQGKTVEHSLLSLGFDKIKNTRVGKYIELEINTATEEEAKSITENACKKLLANPVMEDFTYTIEEIKNTIRT